jgi:branched-chain amino acid aminotransferase
MTEPVYWLNGRCLPASQAALPLNDHGVLYGDGIFEGIRFYHRRPFQLEQHLQRLQHSARVLMLSLPYSMMQIAGAIDEVIAAFDEAEGYIRLVVTRGAGSLGLDPARCEHPNLFILTEQLALVSEAKRRTGIDLITASTRRPGPDVLDPRVKSLNYLNNILARLEARQAGVDEALMLNGEGRVAEASAENLFIVQNGVVSTPPVSDGALQGITRGTLLKLGQETGLAMTERSLTRYDVYTADECFLSGTGAGIIPVRSLDGRLLAQSPGPITQRLTTVYQQRIEQQTLGATAQPSLATSRRSMDHV